MFSKKNENATEEASKKGLIRRFYADLTLTNSVKRMFSAPIEGAEVVKGTVDAVFGGFASANDEVRNETFNEACQRLGVSENKFALIHNQLVSQFYITFFFGLAALTVFFNSLIIHSGIMVSLASIAATIACLANSGQASLQAYRVKMRSLCDIGEWLVKSSEWFPSRIALDSSLSSGDSRLDQAQWGRSVRRARRFFSVSAILFLIFTLEKLFGSKSGIKTEYGSLCFAFIFALLAIRSSIISLQSLNNKEIDLTFWFQNPMQWWPSHPQVKRTSAMVRRRSTNEISKTSDA